MTRRKRLERLANYLLARAQEGSTWSRLIGLLTTLFKLNIDDATTANAVLTGTLVAWALGILMPERLKLGREIARPLPAGSSTPPGPPS